MNSETAIPSDTAIRAATAKDLPAIAALDGKVTGLAKPDYWRDLIERYRQRAQKRHFLVAESGGMVLGFIMGEVRAWEFGSPPCGWIFGLGVDPGARLQQIGTRLYRAICDRLKAGGVKTVRTMLARNDELNMAFFRSQGMMGGSFIQLEMPLEVSWSRQGATVDEAP